MIKQYAQNADYVNLFCVKACYCNYALTDVSQDVIPTGHKIMYCVKNSLNKWTWKMWFSWIYSKEIIMIYTLFIYGQNPAGPRRGWVNSFLMKIWYSHFATEGFKLNYPFHFQIFKWNKICQWKRNGGKDEYLYRDSNKIKALCAEMCMTRGKQFSEGISIRLFLKITY